MNGMPREEHLRGVLHTNFHVILLHRGAKLLLEKQIEMMIALFKGFLVILGTKGTAGVFLDEIRKGVHGKSFSWFKVRILLALQAEDPQKRSQLLGEKV